MSERDIEDQQDMALAKWIRLETTLTAAQNRADQIADQMEAVAKQLRSEVWQVSRGSYPWLAPESRGKIIEDIERVQLELSAAKDAAANLGVTLPPKK